MSSADHSAAAPNSDLKTSLLDVSGATNVYVIGCEAPWNKPADPNEIAKPLLAVQGRSGPTDVPKPGWSARPGEQCGFLSVFVAQWFRRG